MVVEAANMRLATFLVVLIGVGLLACSGATPTQIDPTPTFNARDNALVTRSIPTIVVGPTSVPTAIPVPEPTPVPTTIPAPEPTPVPTAIPVPGPTPVPTTIPTPEPTPVPTAIPVPEPTTSPVVIAKYSFSAESSSTKLTNGLSTKSKRFGMSVAIDGDTIITGDPNDFFEGTDSGSASVFNLSSDTWIQQAQITADDIYQGYLFGEAVDIDGDTVVIGATGGGKGAVYVFVLLNSIWAQQAKLVDLATDSSAQFGKSVAISGNTMVVGAPTDDAPETDSGSAFVFTRTDDVWGKVAQLAPSGRIYTLSNNRFGKSVAIDSERIYVGAPGDLSTNGTDSGAVYVFTLSDGSWVEEAKLHASDGDQGDNFGHSVSVFNDTLVVGAPANDSNGTDSGATYVFVRNGTGGWNEEVKLIASDGAYVDNFGWSVAVGADVAIVGALYANAPGSDSGSLYTYDRTGTNWSERSILTGTGTTSNDRLGTSVSISDNVAVSGAPGNTEKGKETGSIHVFTAQLR
ncbi:MAG: FG-GAP repeat protein [Dehalococcoidia bacterium]|nr:FG-GAP repeat protein [Dehalococcoidia bacterium]